ncbi:MAG TPA: condensation domain-containing protein, partial [Herpetosiphonaceae bacterium]
MNDLSKVLGQLSPEQQALLLRRLNKLKQAAPADELVIQPTPRATNRFPLSFAQQRLWFLDQLDPGNATYNISIALRLVGALDVAAFERSYHTIVERHEALRTTFQVSADGEPVQIVAPFTALPVPVVDLHALAEPEREAEVQRRARQEARQGFDLAAGPLSRLVLLRLAENEHVLLATLHHIIADGWSSDVLVRELIT